MLMTHGNDPLSRPGPGFGGRTELCPAYSLCGKRVFVAGHSGMVGRALIRRLASENCEILTANHDELDLRDQANVRIWLQRERPHAVFLAAGKVGGILANQAWPVDFLYDNLAIATSVIEGAFRADVGKLLYLGSACMYPKIARQPILEEEILIGSL